MQMLRGRVHGDGRSVQARTVWCQAGTIGSARLVASVALLLLSGGQCLEEASAVCSAQCQAQQGAALLRVQSALLGPGQDPSLLLLPPGVAAYGPDGAGMVGSGPGEGPPTIPPLPSSSGLERGPPADWPPGLPPHCRVPGVLLCATLAATPCWSV